MKIQAVDKAVSGLHDSRRCNGNAASHTAPPTAAALKLYNYFALMNMAAVSEAAGSDLSVAGAFQGCHNAEVHPIDCHRAIRVHEGQHHTLPASSVQLEEAV